MQKLQIIKVLILMLCMTTKSLPESELNVFFNDIQISLPELQGYESLGLDVQFCHNIGEHEVSYNGKRIEIDRLYALNDPIFLVSLARNLQLSALCKDEDNLSSEILLAYKMIAKYYSLRYFQTLTSSQKKQYRKFLEKNEAIELALLEAFGMLVHDDYEGAAECIGAYFHEQAVSKQQDISDVLPTAKKIMLRALPFAVPTHELMSYGCDDRITLDYEKKLNKYFTSTVPHEDVLMRSSSTTSFSSKAAYIYAEKVRQKLLKKSCSSFQGDIHLSHVNAMRERLHSIFNLSSCKQAIYTMFSPSGTDAEMLVSLFALNRHPYWQQGYDKSKTLVTNIITAEGEIGSKSNHAAHGHYFNKLLPTNQEVPLWEPVNGFAQDTIQIIQVNARDSETGQVQDFEKVEAEIEHELARAIALGKIGILHMVHYSKTGVQTPRLDFVVRMKKLYDRSLLVLVDAAQTRCSREVIKKYLDHDFFVLITGSKFFGSPSFCGVLFMPKSEVGDLLDDTHTSFVPEGCKDFFTQHDIDPRLVVLKKNLGAWNNYGMIMRWEAALFEIERYYSIPKVRRSHIRQRWYEGVKELFDHCEYLDVLQEEGVVRDWSIEDDLAGGGFSIVCFAIKDKNTGRYFDVESLKKVHQLMQVDISSTVPKGCTQLERAASSQKFLIGQPVSIVPGKNGFGILRIALSAPIIYQAASSQDLDQGVNKTLEDDQKILRKLSVIARNFDQL